MAEQSRSEQSDSPRPGDTLVNEGGETAYWLEAAYSEADIRNEWDYLFESGAELERVWLLPRWTTPEERADPDRLYDLFGDEREDMSTEVAYEMVKPGTPGAHVYLTTEV